MKNVFFILMIIGFAAFSCRGNEEDVQNIDQVVNLYIKDATGKDLLNSKLTGSFFSVALVDLNAERDNVPISSFSLLKDADTVNYIDYAAGAVRILTDSVSATNKTYESDFYINLTKKIDSVNSTLDTDTVKIEYSWTPTLFQISKLYYNGKLKFTKVAGEPNVVTIIK